MADGNCQRKLRFFLKLISPAESNGRKDVTSNEYMTSGAAILLSLGNMSKCVEARKDDAAE